MPALALETGTSWNHGFFLGLGFRVLGCFMVLGFRVLGFRVGFKVQGRFCRFAH